MNSEMPKVMICQGDFTPPYVDKIRAAVPTGWHIVIRRAPATAVTVAPDILVVLHGSAAQQARQEVKVRFGGGAATGALTLPLAQLGTFFARLGQK